MNEPQSTRGPFSRPFRQTLLEQKRSAERPLLRAAAPSRVSMQVGSRPASCDRWTGRLGSSSRDTGRPETSRRGRSFAVVDAVGPLCWAGRAGSWISATMRGHGEWKLIGLCHGES